MILSKEVQTFILENLNSNISELLLKKPVFKEVSNKEIAQQIMGRNVAAKKFPFLLKEHIIFPPQLNLEQASSQNTAEFKAQNLAGNRFLDLTCGFGIDAFFLSKNFNEIFLVEKNAELLQLVKHNWKILGKNASFLNEDLESFLAKNTLFFDVIYLDPARRDLHNQKKFLLEDLSPNLLKINHLLWNFTNTILVKLSPLIDIQYLYTTLPTIEKIDIIAVKNEVKEVFITLSKTKKNEKTACNCINLQSNEPIFSFFIEDLSKKAIFYSEIRDFLYIPNNSLLKSGAFNLISEYFQLKKLHQNTHLYTSDEKITNFSGRILKTTKISAKNIKKGGKYNVISKNYPLSAEEIKKKYQLTEGGDNYLIFTQSVGGKEIVEGKIISC